MTVFERLKYSTTLWLVIIVIALATWLLVKGYINGETWSLVVAAKSFDYAYKEVKTKEISANVE